MVRITFFGLMINTERTISVPLCRGWIMSYRVATLWSWSPRVGNQTRAFCASSISLKIHSLLGRDWIDAYRQHLHVTTRELLYELCRAALFSGACQRLVCGMQKQHGPMVADSLVELYRPSRRVLAKVGGNVAEMKTHENLTVWMDIREGRVRG